MATLTSTRSLPSGRIQVRVTNENLEVRQGVNITRQALGIAPQSKSSLKPNWRKLGSESSKGSSRSPSAPDEYKDPFFKPPPRLGVHSAPYVQSSQSEDTPNLDSLLESDSLLNVEVASSVEGTNFYIPLSLMVEREIMMRKTAEEFGIGLERWSSSLLYREWRKAQDDISSTAEDRAFQLSNGDVTIFLNPEADCAASNHSQSLKWTPWLTTCIRAFYNTGTVRFPNDCVGSDVLLALEYFGIVYTPDQLVFDSFGAYLRVKLWSEYFTHRSGLAQWVVEKLMQTNSKHSHIFVTSPSLQEGDLLVGSKRADVLDGHLQLDPTKYAGTPSNAVVHDFFHDEDRPEDVEYPLDSLMRDDFAHYIENSLPGTRVTFGLRDVQVVRTGKTVQRATLHVAYVEPPHQQITPPKERRTVAKDAPGRRALLGSTSSTSLPNGKTTVLRASTPPRVNKTKQLTHTSSQKPRSQSPVVLLRRVSSAIRTSNSIIDNTGGVNGALENRSGQFSLTYPESPQADVSTNNVSVIPIASQIDEEEIAGIRQRSRHVVDTVDSVGDGVVTSDCVHGESPSLPDNNTALPSNYTDAAMLGPGPQSPTPYDEDLVQLNMTLKASKVQTKPELPDVRAPVNAIWEGDLNTVVSALTSPFREDESIKPSKSSAPSEAPSAGIPVDGKIAVLPLYSKEVSAESNQRKTTPEHVDVTKALLVHHRSIQQILGEEATQDTMTDFNVPSLTTDGSTIVNPFHTMGSTGAECGGNEILSSTFAYFFGTSKSCEIKKSELSTHCPSPTDIDFDVASLVGKGKGAMSTIEAILPDIDLQTIVEELSYRQDKPTSNNRKSTSDPPLETIESSAAAWLRRAINVNQMIFDDPVPASEQHDEYLRLARQAESMRYNDYIRGAHRNTSTAGTLVKDILDSLLNDNNSQLGGSVASTDASTNYSAAGSVSTPSTRLTKAGSFIPFDCDSSLDSIELVRDAAGKENDSNKETNGSLTRNGANNNIMQVVPPSSLSMQNSTDSAGPPTQVRVSSRERARRFPTPRRNVDRQSHSQSRPSYGIGAVQEVTNKSSLDNRPTKPRTTTRHASPLSRLPALISGRKRGKNRGDETTETEITAKVHNLGRDCDETGEMSIKQTPQQAHKQIPVEVSAVGNDTAGGAPTSRLAGLFRSKGLVRRKSLSEAL